ncbi:MAG: hypothetical protein IPM24_01070 [Bryobacterales bacterium]|nr:hypothetical protein [Bryobacterales bacterium]
MIEEQVSTAGFDPFLESPAPFPAAVPFETLLFEAGAEGPVLERYTGQAGNPEGDRLEEDEPGVDAAATPQLLLHSSPPARSAHLWGLTARPARAHQVRVTGHEEPVQTTGVPAVPAASGPPALPVRSVVERPASASAEVQGAPAPARTDEPRPAAPPAPFPAPSGTPSARGKAQVAGTAAPVLAAWHESRPGPADGVDLPRRLPPAAFLIQPARAPEQVTVGDAVSLAPVQATPETPSGDGPPFVAPEPAPVPGFEQTQGTLQRGPQTGGAAPAREVAPFAAESARRDTESLPAGWTAGKRRSPGGGLSLPAWIAPERLPDREASPAPAAGDSGPLQSPVTTEFPAAPRPPRPRPDPGVMAGGRVDPPAAHGEPPPARQDGNPASLGRIPVFASAAEEEQQPALRAAPSITTAEPALGLRARPRNLAPAEGTVVPGGEAPEAGLPLGSIRRTSGQPEEREAVSSATRRRDSFAAPLHSSAAPPDSPLVPRQVPAGAVPVGETPAPSTRPAGAQPAAVLPRDLAPAGDLDAAIGQRPPQPAPVSRLSLTVPGSTLRTASADPVALEFFERRGEVQMLVRTADPAAAREIRQEAAGLVASLEAAGFEADWWRPARGQESSGDAPPRQQRHSQGGDGEPRKDRRQEDDPAAWAEAMDEARPARRERKESR